MKTIENFQTYQYLFFNKIVKKSMCRLKSEQINNTVIRFQCLNTASILHECTNKSAGM